MKFLPIYPRGLGTREVESLGSFLLRCAIWHGLSTPEYLRCLASKFSSVLDSDCPLNESSNGPREHFLDRTTMVRPTRTTKGIIAMLNSLYRTELFSSLGIFRLYPVFTTYQGCVGDSFAWCPICWQEDRDQEQEPYFRVIWNLSGSQYCEKHDSGLLSKCPGCGVRVTYRYRERLDTCAICGVELSGDFGETLHGSRSSRYPDLADLVEFIQENPDWRFRVTDPATIVPSIVRSENHERSFIDDVCDRHLVLYKRKPSLLQLRRVCQPLNVELWRVLSGNDKQLPLFGVGSYDLRCPEPLAVKARNKNDESRIMLKKLKRLMHENSDSPKPVSFYAQKLDISSDGLAYRFPMLYERMVSYYRFHQRAEREKLRMQIKTILELLRASGWLDRGVKKICSDMMEEWGFPKNLSRKEIKRIRDCL